MNFYYDPVLGLSYLSPLLIDPIVNVSSIPTLGPEEIIDMWFSRGVLLCEEATEIEIIPQITSNFIA